MPQPGYLEWQDSLDSVPDPIIRFRAWWEVESINPSEDDFAFEYQVGNGDWQAATVTPAFGPPASPPGARPDAPISNLGFEARPNWQDYEATVPGAEGESDVGLRFRFEVRDNQYNGFRGLAVDDIRIFDGANLEMGPFNFESGPGPWTTSGFWRIQPDTQNIRVLSPDINPTLVTLAQGDDGSLPAPFPGKQVAWFGEPETGTFCGQDFARHAPITLAAEPPFDLRPLDDTHTVRLTLTNRDGSPAGQALRWSVSGVNSQPPAEVVTGDDGAADVFWTGPEPGTDMLEAYHDANGNDTQDPGEAVASAEVLWRAPVAGESVNVTVEGGEVFVKPPPGVTLRPDAGAAQAPGFVQLTRPRQIPVGSVVDTKQGTVGLTSARNLSGATQKGSFTGGRFRIRQRRASRPVTELKMTGGSFGSCTRNVNRSSARTAARRIRRLRGNARGRFRTRGRNSSATVRGTRWGMIDQCNGTLTRVRSGVVRVRDFGKNRTVTLRRGRTYLARPSRR